MSTFETLHKKMRVKDSIIAKQSQDLAALQAQLDDFIERRKEDLAVVASQQTRLDAARAEIVTLRTTLTNVRGENPTYFKHDEFGNQVPAGNMASRRQDEIDEALVRTAKDYEGLVVVLKAEWDRLLGGDEQMISQGEPPKGYSRNLAGELTGAAETSDPLSRAKSDLAATSAKLSEAEKDTRRLDWLIRRIRVKADEGFQLEVEPFAVPQEVRYSTDCRGMIDAAIAKGGSATTEPIGSPEHCERMAKFLADRKDPELWGAVGALNWAAKHIRELTS